jgi:hypothetical protein
MLKTVLTRGIEILMPNLSKRYGFPSRIAKKVVKKWDPSINYYSNGNFPPPSFSPKWGPGCPPRTEIYVPEHGILGFTVPAWENGHFGQIWTISTVLNTDSSVRSSIVTSDGVPPYVTIDRTEESVLRTVEIVQIWSFWSFWSFWSY